MFNFIDDEFKTRVYESVILSFIKLKIFFVTIDFSPNIHLFFLKPKKILGKLTKFHYFSSIFKNFIKIFKLSQKQTTVPPFNCYKLFFLEKLRKP